MADVDRSNNNFHMAQFCKAFPINRSSKLLLTLTHAFSSYHMVGLFPIRFFFRFIEKTNIHLRYMLSDWGSVCIFDVRGIS